MKKIILISVLFLPVFLRAQVPVNPGRFLEDIQRRQQQETQDLLRQREVDSAVRAQELAPRAFTPPPPQAEPEGCLDIKKISVSGITKISRLAVRKKVNALTSSCMSKNDLQSVQSLIQQMYVSKGYIGARMYFDFSETHLNILHIITDEGFLEEIKLLQNGLEQTNLFAKTQLFDAFPFQKGKVLNLRNIEQGMDQMNKLGSNAVTMEVRPGELEGGSVVVLNNQKKGRNQITASYDNSGSDSTGRYRANASLSRDNLLFLNDNLFVNASTTLWNDRDIKYSDSVSANLRLPFGYWTLGGGFSLSKYLTTTEGDVAFFESDGSSNSYNANIERLLFRGASYKFSLGAQLTVKDAKNYLEGILLESSSRALAVASPYLTFTYYSRLGSVYIKLDYNKGVNDFGARRDPQNLMYGEPRAQFESYSGYLNYSKDIWKINYTAAVNGQYSKDNLFSSEQIMAGGEGTVRGFRDGSVSGEKGYYVRNDLRISAHSIFGDSRNPWTTDLLQKTYLGAFADWGYIKPNAFGQSATLSGAGLKISYYGKHINGNFVWARSLSRPEYLVNEGNIFYFNIALDLTF